MIRIIGLTKDTFANFCYNCWQSELVALPGVSVELTMLDLDSIAGIQALKVNSDDVIHVIWNCQVYRSNTGYPKKIIAWSTERNDALLTLMEKFKLLKQPPTLSFVE